MKPPEDTPKRSLSRRKFLAATARRGAVAGAAGMVGSPMWLQGQEAASGPIDCGPPPKSAPQRRTGGEAFPGAARPVVPLRRTEKKRPPSPPALIGKMALGPVRWITRDGKRTAYRDWTTDPADVNTLLARIHRELGIHYRAVESDFEHFSYDPRELPVLLFAGHNAFELPGDVRPKLARYVADGGTILADACCGWTDFTESFRREMEQVFPGRPMRKMLPDDPIFSTFHKLGKFTYKKADGSTYRDAPCLESIEFGCRSGVIFSPCDLTCGWDGHEHPRGLRVVIGQARQIGANLVTYVLGNYQLGRFLSSTKVYHESTAPTRDDFVFAQIKHDGDWDPDPSAVHNLLKYAKDNSTLEVKFKRQNVSLDDPTAATYPLLYMTGHRGFAFSDEETGRLAKYLRAGGMLLADACCGRLAFDAAFRAQIAKVLPESKLQRLPADDPLYHCHYDIERVDYTPRVREDFGAIATPQLEGIRIDGRLAVVYSRFDLGNGWEQFPHAYGYGLKEEPALKVGTNVIVYAMTH